MVAICFLAFDTFKHMLSDKNGCHITGPPTMLAEVTTGVFKSIFTVTPFKSMKTSLINHKKCAVPQYCSLIYGSRSILAERGLCGIGAAAGFITV
jgi:hypothetical protein